MKNRITFFFLNGLAAGVVALLAQNAQGQIVYNNTGQSGGDSSEVGNYSFGNGGNSEAGNEIVLGSGTGSYTLSTFEFQFFLTGTTFSGSPSVELNFYANTGAAVSGYASPATTPLYSSGFSPISAFTDASGDTLTYTLPAGTVVPADFTWTVAFSGVPAGDTAGLSIFNSSTVNTHGVPLPAIGGNYNDAWVNNGGTWTLVQSTPNANDPGLQFGAIATAVPEPSTIALGVMGACGLLARRRKS